jgi:hypothetical protein
MSTPHRAVLLSGPEDDLELGKPLVKFRLTYEGCLRPTQRDARSEERNPLAAHKHYVRRAFHRQLKHLWHTNQFLRECKVDHSILPGAFGPGFHENVELIPMLEAVESQYHQFGYRFVPLVIEEWQLLCSLDVLFLRRDIPGSAFTAGDIDNRIKTLIDALRCPRSQNELVGDDARPRNGEDPFFCLLEDDKQISHFAVETDTLLDPPSDDEEDQRKAA